MNTDKRRLKKPKFGFSVLSVFICVHLRPEYYSLQPELLPDGARRLGAIQRIEMQARRAAFQQGFTQPQRHVQAQAADGIEVFTVTFEAPPPPTAGARRRTP